MKHKKTPTTENKLNTRDALAKSLGVLWRKHLDDVMIKRLKGLK